VFTAPVGTQVAEHLCLVAAGLPPEDPNARAHFQPFSSRDAHVLQQLRQAFDFAAAAVAPPSSARAAAAAPGNVAAVAAAHRAAEVRAAAAAAVPLAAAPAAAVVPCRGRLSLVLRHVLEVGMRRRFPPSSTVR
jgi:hypothetical protein